MAALFAQALAAQPAAQSQQNDDPNVYLGGGKPLSPGMERNYTGPVEQAKYATLSQTIMDVYRWDPATKKANIAKIEKSLGIEIKNDGDLEDAWKYLATTSAKYLSAGQSLTPWDVLDLYSKDGVLGGKLGKTSTHTQVNLTDAATAKAWVSDIMRQKLGRDATAAEEREFTDLLNSQERAHPTISNSTTDPYGNTTSQTTTGGVTQAGIAEQYADSLKGDAEYGEYQGSTTFRDAFFNAIKSPV